VFRRRAFHLLWTALALTAVVTAWPQPAPVDAGPVPAGPAVRPDLAFGVYPGSLSGEFRVAVPVDPNVAFDRILTLKHAAPAARRPFHVHLYTSWDVYSEYWVGAELDRYGQAGIGVILTLRYQPPPGHEGDAAGFAQFVRQVARTYASHPAFWRLTVGNEANLATNPMAHDGPYPGVREAIVMGILAAREEFDRAGSTTLVGMNFGSQSREENTQFMDEMIGLGGPRFRDALGYVGVNVYPGVWEPSELADPYGAMAGHLAASRDALTAVGLGPHVWLDVLENGFPTRDEHDQAARLEAFVRAVIDRHAALNIGAYTWFSLWDADSSHPDPFAHYGLLRSDLSPKPSFEVFRAILAAVP